jgi:hypothetical protein
MQRLVGALLLGVYLTVARVRAHGTLNLPESRNGAQAGLGLGQGGRTQPYSVAYWFTDETRHTGNATIADDSCPLLTCFQCETSGCASTRLARTPWRAPGTAPLAGGPCGTIGWDGASGRNTSVTRGTDLPDDFPYMPRGTQAPVWRMGGVESVAWGLAVNHGGGYSYRLCPRSEPLTEACFQQHPLAFVGNTSDIVGAHGEVLHTIPASRTTIGAAQWTRNPVPDQHDPGIPPNFPPAVPGLAGHCCDDGFGQAWNLMDRVRVPSGLTPGEWVLSWRWDCEELPQVWTNCADVRLSG